MTTRSAILFLVFNRPDTTRQVFEAIRMARPARLYVAADGARPERQGESQLCDATRAIATAVDWRCEVHTLFRDENLGCKRAVSTAVDWFFAQEPEGIILEDDCLPDPSFFQYCDDLLERYRHDERIMCVSGDNFISSIWRPSTSYYFSHWAHIWGWATWRRAWARYDVSMASWPNDQESRLLQRLFPRETQAQKYWQRTFNETYHGIVDTWDYQWFLACWRHGGLSCTPARNLISNLGFGTGATHTLNSQSRHANLARHMLPTPLRHPESITRAVHADRWTTRHVLSIRESVFSRERWREVFNRTRLRFASNQK